MMTSSFTSQNNSRSLHTDFPFGSPSNKSQESTSHSLLLRQTSQAPPTFLSSIEDVDQQGGHLPSDIRALFGVQKAKSEHIMNHQSRKNTGFSESSYGSEEATIYSSSPVNHHPKAFQSQSTSSVSLKEANSRGLSDIWVSQINPETVRSNLLSYNQVCPYCSAKLHPDTLNHLNTLVVATSFQRRQYLAHKGCYIKSMDDLGSPRLTSSSLIPYPTISLFPMPVSTFNINDYHQAMEKRKCFMRMEGLHPISSYLYFQMDKLSYFQRHMQSFGECLYFDFTGKSTNIFEPASYTIPYDEFRLALTFYPPDEDPYLFEFMVDLSAVAAYPNTGSVYAEVFYNHQGNKISLSLQVCTQLQAESQYKDEFNELAAMQRASNFNSCYPKGGQSKPQYKSIQVILKNLFVALPLKRVLAGTQNVRGEAVMSNLTLYPAHTAPTLYQTHDEINAQRPLYPNTISSPNLSLKAPTSIMKPTSQTSIILTNSTAYNTSHHAVSTTLSSIGEFAPHFQKPHVRNSVRSSTSQPFSLFNKKVSFDNFDELEERLDCSPLLGSSRLSMQGGLSPRKGNPITPVRAEERKQSIMSDSPSGNRMSGHLLSRLSTLSSENDWPGSNATPRNARSMQGSELDQYGQSIQEITEEIIKIEDHLENIEEFAKTFQGSKLLQEYIVNANPQQIELIIDRISGSLEDLMLDNYANYMIQSLMQNCSPEQRYTLLKRIAPSMVKIAKHKTGTHCLQVIVTVINQQIEHELIREVFKDCVKDLVIDSYATHVVQKLINTTPLSDIAFLYEPLIGNLKAIAKHPSGFPVFKHLLIKIDKAPELKKRALASILEAFEDLIKDQYGNYAIQYALEFLPRDCNDIMEKILVKVISYSSQKYTSNVIEKCLAVAQPQYLKRVVNEMMKAERLADLMKNKYGNYVLLHILIYTEMEEKERIMQGISRNVEMFHGTKYKGRWLKFLVENPLNIPWSGAKSYSGSPQAMSPENSQLKGKEGDLEKVKKIWREMNKQDKKDTPGGQGSFEDTFNSSENVSHTGGQSNKQRKPKDSKRT